MSNLIDKKKYEERKNQYILKIKKWLNQTKFNIVVVENSGYNFNELPDNNHRFEKIISENLKDETLFIRQFNNEQCEIVGCKYDLKEYLFDFPKKDDHVENEYCKKINTYKEPFDVWMNVNNEVLTLPEMKLDCKTRRGLGTYYRYL